MNTKLPSILVVDDIQSNRETLKRHLQCHNFEVITAEGGRQALALLADRDFEVVLLDIMMPSLSGLKILREIRTNTKWQHLPVIMVSGEDEEETLPECLNMGANDYVSKPVNISVLNARIRSQLSCKCSMDKALQKQAKLQTSLENLKLGVIGRVHARFESTSAKARLIDAIDSLGDGFALFDAEYRLQFTNKKFYELHQLSPSDVSVGSSYEDFLRKVADKGVITDVLGREDLWVTEQLKDVEKESEHFISSGRWLKID